MIGETLPGYILVGCLGLLCMYPFVRRAVDRDIFEPIYAVSAMYFLYFGFFTLHLMRVDDNYQRLIPSSFETLELALFYTILGLFSLQIAYYSSIPESLSRILPSASSLLNVDDQVVSRLVYWTYGLGNAMRLFLVYQGWHVKFDARTLVGVVPAYGYIIDYLSVLAPLGFMLGCVYWMAGHDKPFFTFLLWFVMFPVEIIFAFLSGSKGAFIPVVAAPLLGRFYFRTRRVPYLSLLIALLFMAFIVTPSVTALRANDAVQLRSMPFFEGLQFAAVNAASTTLEDGPAVYVCNAYETVIERLNGSGVFGIVIESTPDYLPYQYGRTFIGGLAVLLVPTFVWPEKYAAYQEVADWAYLVFHKEGIGGIAITQVGEFYLNFHLAGVVLGMFFLGLLYKTSYLLLSRNRTAIALWIYIVMWSMFLLIEYPLAAWFSNIIKQVGIMLVILFASKIFPRKTMRLTE